MSSTSLFVIKFSVKSSISGRLQPIIRGDLNMAHSVSIVYCSSGVKLLIRGVPLMALCAIGPMGSISASGQCPLQIYFCHFRQSGNCSFRASQSSQKSSEMRHSWATFCKCFMFSTGAGPGERLRTMGLFPFLTALVIASISSCA